MLGEAGLDGSVPRAVERGRDRIAATSRTLHALRFADGKTLELGLRTIVMGVLNLSPDSFSDGGRFQRLPDALDAARRMAGEGAQLIDVGGESTRPGASPVDEELETRRVVPVIEAIKRETGVRVSVDTSKAGVARRGDDETVILCVVDDGAGIPEDVLPRIFEPQFSTRSTGAGLGLAIVHRVVRAWGGSVSVRSVVGEGTSVSVSLRTWPDGREVKTG